MVSPGFHQAPTSLVQGAHGAPSSYRARLPPIPCQSTVSAPVSCCGLGWCKTERGLRPAGDGLTDVPTPRLCVCGRSCCLSRGHPARSSPGVTPSGLGLFSPLPVCWELDTAVPRGSNTPGTSWASSWGSSSPSAGAPLIPVGVVTDRGGRALDVVWGPPQVLVRPPSPLWDGPVL